MNFQTIAVLVLLFGFGLPAAGSAQNLSDTIWKGTATVKIPALTRFQDGRPQAFPAVSPSGITFTLPVEAWFLTSKEFLVVLDQRALGHDPARARLQPLIGSWRGITYASSLNKVRAGTYGKGAFRATSQRLVASSSSYKGTRTLQGRYQVPRPNRMEISGSFSSTPNPSGPSQPKYSGGVPTISAVLTKTTRRPSSEINTAFADTP
jgi:hypothetical protein